MTRIEARELLRRRLNSPEGDPNWSNSTLNTLLGLGQAFVWKKVRAVNREASLFWDVRNLTSGQNWYEKPAGTTGVVEVAVLDAGGTTYTPLDRLPYQIASDPLQVTSGSPVPGYCHRANFIGIFPAPTANITSGLRLLIAGTPAAGADTDDYSPLELTLQYGIVLYATILAKGESPEDDGKDQRDLAVLVADIPTDYSDLDVSQPIALNSPAAAKARGFGRPSVQHRNDLDPGRSF